LPLLLRARSSLGALLSALGLTASLLSGCAVFLPQSEALRAQWPIGVEAKAELDAVPFFPQQDFQCGPAALATVLAFLGVPVGPDDLVARVYLPDRRGSLQIEMLAAPRSYGLVTMRLAPHFDDLLREVQAGNPVIVLQDYGAWPVSYWHYAVIVGFDRETRKVFLRSGEKRRLEIPFAVFEYTWKESRYWAMVAMPPDRIPGTATEDQWVIAVAAMGRVASRDATRSAYARAMRQWPDSLNGAIGLSNTLYDDGNLAAVESILRTANARHPKSPVVLNNLAQVISDQRRHAEALTLIDEAVAQGGAFSAAVQATRDQIRDRIRREGPDQTKD
jgi:Peptidase_C39 like family